MSLESDYVPKPPTLYSILIECAGRLETERSAYQEKYENLAEQIAVSPVVTQLVSARKEISLLRDALEFYANRESYKTQYSAVPGIEPVEPVEHDGGHIARLALHKEGP